MYIWDVDLQDSVPLRRVGGGGINLVSWSPDTHKLLAATTGVTFRYNSINCHIVTPDYQCCQGFQNTTFFPPLPPRVWDTTTWVPERWRVLSGHVKTACWSPCSTVLLFTTSEESVVYALQFKPNCAQLDTMFYSDTPLSEQAARVVINLAQEEVGNGIRC